MGNSERLLIIMVVIQAHEQVRHFSERHLARVKTVGTKTR